MQLIVLIIGGICLFILLVHLFMENDDKNSAFKICEILLVILVGIATVIWGVIPEFVMIINKQEDKIRKDLTNSSGKVYDDNGHTVDIDIKSESQVDVLSVKNVCKTDDYYIVYNVLADVKISQGYLREVPVIVEKNIWGTDTIVKWDYSLDDKKYYYEKVEQEDSIDNEDIDYDQDDTYGDKHYVKFEYLNAPAYTIGDVLNYLGVRGTYEVAEACVTSITNNYDALEYYVLWRDKTTKDRQKGWVRAVYNQQLKQWELCDAEKNITSLSSGLSEYASESDDEYDNEYTDDYVIVKSDTSLSWSEIE